MLFGEVVAHGREAVLGALRPPAFETLDPVQPTRPARQVRARAVAVVAGGAIAQRRAAQEAPDLVAVVVAHGLAAELAGGIIGSEVFGEAPPVSFHLDARRGCARPEPA